MQAAETLVAAIRPLGRCIVALSGGVDSAVVAKAACLALGGSARAVTAVSPSLAQAELEDAVRTARAVGIEHELVHTNELNQDAYRRNDPDRCYHCKSELYTVLSQIARREGGAVILNGANRDDVGDYRPGMAAAREYSVRSPLLECALGKSEVRELAAFWGLDVKDKPASPCLASRVAYGEEVTPERLRMIESAERWLKGEGLAECRVRFHRGNLARVEVPLSALDRLCREPLRSRLVAELGRLGFQYVTVDLGGFRSGSMNDVLLVDVLTRSVPST
jgi:uncharacterized protein